MRWAAKIAFGLLAPLALASCTPAPDAPTADEVPTPAAPTVAPWPQVSRSNAIPTMAELLEIGLTVDEAECFLAEIDPDNTGELTDPDRFMIAFTACFTGTGGAP